MKRLTLIALVVFSLLIGNYAFADVPLSPQAQQSNPNAQNNQVQQSPFGFTQQVTTQGIQQLTTNSWVYTVIAVVVSIFIIVLSLILLARASQLQNAYVGDPNNRRLDGRQRLFIWGKGWVDFRATEVPIDEIEEKLQILKEIDEIRNAPNVEAAMNNVIDKVRDGRLRLYEIKVISRKNLRIRGNLGYSLLLSSEPIDDRKFFYTARNSVFAPFSGSWKEYPRIIDCIAQSKIYTNVEMADRGETTTVYVVGPISGDFVKEKQQTFGNDLEEFHISPVSINVSMIQVAGGKERELSEILAICRTTADTYQTAASFKRQSKIMTEANSKLADDLVISNAEKMFLKAKVGERALVIIGEKVLQRMTQESWMWMFGAIMMGLIGLELPHWIPSLATTDPAVTFFACEAFLVMMKAVTQKSGQDAYGKAKNQDKVITMGSGEQTELNTI